MGPNPSFDPKTGPIPDENQEKGHQIGEPDAFWTFRPVEKPNAHQLFRLGELPVPSIDDVPDGRGVLVKVLRVGLCGTDREMQAGEYGAPPPESDFLVLGHESFGVVEQVGPKVTGLAPGD